MLDHLPAYGIPNYVIDTYMEDGILYAHTDTDQTLVIDNTNLSGTTLGRRRLRVKAEKLNISHILYTLKEVLDTNYNKYISSKGKLFSYKKTKTTPVRYYEIKQFKLVEGVGILLYFKEFNYPIKIEAKQFEHEQYIGLMDFSGGKLVYELSTQMKPDTWRKI